VIELSEGFILIIWLTFGIVLLVVSLNDFLFFRIENEYTLFLIGLYFVSWLLGISGHDFWNALMIFVLIFAIVLILNRNNLIGGGDVKLLLPLLLFAEGSGLTFLLWTSIGGAILSSFYLLFSRQIFFVRRKIITSLYILSKNKNKSFLLKIVLLSLDRVDRRVVALRRCPTHAAKQEVPYGIALSFGGFYVIIERFCG
jgi:Flp pilus assembly protein protease CpaA